MSLMRWNPFRELEEVMDRYSRSRGAGNLLQLPLFSGAQEAMSRPDWIPAVDIIEKKDGYQLKVELPEVKKEDVKVSVEQGVLTITGERRLEVEEGEEGSLNHRLERVYGNFSRSFSLPDGVDEKHIDANYQNGMLTLSIPCVTKPKTQAIEVKVH